MTVRRNSEMYCASFFIFIFISSRDCCCIQFFLWVTPPAILAKRTLPADKTQSVSRHRACLFSDVARRTWLANSTMIVAAIELFIVQSRWQASEQQVLLAVIRAEMVSSTSCSRSSYTTTKPSPPRSLQRTFHR